MQVFDRHGCGVDEPLLGCHDLQAEQHSGYRYDGIVERWRGAGAGDTAAWGSAVTGLNSVPINQALTWDGMGVVGDAVADMVVYGAAG